MDTKLKKSKFYSTKAKVFAVLLIYVFSLVTGWGLIAIFDIGQGDGMSPFVYDDYFETDAFNNQYSQLVRDAINVNLAYKNEDFIKAGKTLNEERLLEDFIKDYGIELEMMDYFDTLAKGGSVKSNGTSLPDNEFWDYITLYNEFYPRYKKFAIQRQLSDYKTSVSELEAYPNFMFYMENTKTGDTIQNTFLDTIKNQDIQTTIDGPYVEGRPVSDTNYYYYYEPSTRETTYYYYDNYQNSIEKILQDNGYTFYSAVKFPLEPGDNLYIQYMDFQHRKETLPILIGTIIGSLSFILLLSIYVIFTAGRSYKNGEVTLLGVDKIFNDVQTLFVIVVAVISLILGFNIIREIFIYNTGRTAWLYLMEFFLFALLLFDLSVILTYLTSMSRQLKAKQLISNTLVAAVIRAIGGLFSGRTFKGWIVFCMFIYAGINMFLFGFLILARRTGGFMMISVAIIIFNIIAALILARALRSLTKIMIAVKETSKGDLNYQLDLSEISPSFLNFAKDVSGIQSGLNQAVGEAVKGERMKADLITNVSHDLKTPLTSIITYVDLLRKEKLSNERATGYVEILEEKSNRLKQLIEDLIEASKASSGNLAVNFDRLDLRLLVMQASGEYEEKIERAGLNFIINSTEETAIKADSKHMWRILENLFSNAIKYAMPNTRVYIDIMKTDSMGILVVKNISANPVEITVDQLTERFVRGDESRTTEGSGLGLSIAKSLTELQNGKMEISVDGDLFKVSIKIPLWKEEEAEAI